MNKKFFGVLLALCLTLALLTCAAAAADVTSSGSCGENVTWTLDSDGLLTIRGTGAITSHPWTPSEVRAAVIESGVTRIGDYAFSDCADMTSITLPDTLTGIGFCAFEYCLSLESISLPDSVKSFSEGAFACCESLKSIVLPNGVKGVSGRMFDSCSNLESVTLPDSVKRIGECAFSNCGKLTEIDIPSGVTVLENRAFEYCVALTDVTIPNGVTSIPTSLFYNCAKLEHVSVPGSVTYIGDSAFANCFQLKTLSIPSGVTQIGSYAFDHSGLTSITLPDSVRTIQDGTFEFCADLTSVVLPAGLARIQDSAFCGCSGLTNITIPSGVTAIDSDAFARCGLTGVSLPAGLTEIGYSAFFCCEDLTEITIPGSVRTIREGAFCKCTALQRATFENGVTAVGSEMFNECDALKTVVLPNSVTRIGDNAFNGCTALTGVTLPDGVTAIGEGAFRYCAGLTEITIPGSVKSVGDFAFYNCIGLKSLTVREGAGTLGYGCFDECIYLQVLWYEGSESQWNEIGFDAGLLAPVRRHFISAQPQDAAAAVGSTARFAIDVSGSDLTYQWLYKNPGGTAWNLSTMTGAKTAALSVPVTEARIGRQFLCVVKDGEYAYRSHPATLTRLAPPVIKTQPQPVTADAGAAVKFTVEASGSGLSYQWQYKAPGTSEWHDSGMTGAKTATLSVTATAARNGQQYRCVVKNGAGSATSSAAKLTVRYKPVIKTQPQDVTAAYGDTAVFTVQALGGNLTYQWQYKTPNGSTWKDSSLSGAKTATLRVVAEKARSGQQYRCVVTNALGSTTSEPAKLLAAATVQPAIRTQPKNVSTTAGQTVQFTVKATGGSLSYQWQFKAPGTDTWYNSGMEGAKTATLTVPATAARNGQQYRCVVKNASGSVVSDAAKLTVK